MLLQSLTIAGTRRPLSLLAACAAITTLILAHSAVAGEIAHDLRITLDPVSHRIEARDEVTLPGEYLADHDIGVSFLLRAGLSPALIGAEGQPSKIKPFDTLGELEHFYFRLPAHTQRFTLSYAGTLPDAGANGSGPGLYLDRDAFWYPVLGNELLRYSMQVTLPAGWTAISQGRRVEDYTEDGGARVSRWHSERPQEQIWLLADRFHEHHLKSDAGNVCAFLLSPDLALAEPYLQAAKRYLSMYGRLLGPYPYEKFALVESTAQTGFAMPSFTLVGSQVLRLPFFVDTAYPHEILHNWFGNSVYPDFESGNWSEGLTTYLADHLLAEQRGEGARFRRAALWSYTHYVDAADEQPLRAFREHHGGSSRGVGYDKAMLFFHSLRLRLGDAVFLRALRGFYEQHKFRIASWDDLRRSFEQAGGQDLGGLFEQWLGRTGAPTLSVQEISVQRAGDGYRLKGVIVQEPATAVDRFLRVPVAVTYEGSGQALQTTIAVGQARTAFELAVPGRPSLLEIDPDHDVFRRLNQEEFPPTLGEAFAARQVTVVAPADAPPPVREGLVRLIAVLKTRIPQVRQFTDRELEALPEEGMVLLVGWDNRYLPLAVKALAGQAQLDQGQISFAGGTFRRDAASVIIAARRRTASGPQDILWLGCDCPPTMHALASRLTRYGPYSYLVFRNQEVANVVKGEWSSTYSPLRVVLGEEGTDVVPGVRSARQPLIAAPNLE